MARSARWTVASLSAAAAIATAACSKNTPPPSMPSQARAAAEPAPERSATKPSGTQRQLGEVDFEISCDQQAQHEFDHATALLHHMMYRQARQAFESITEQHPTCAMAHWGISMTLFHPLWGDPPTAEELERGAAAIARARELGLETARERGYVDAAAAYYEMWQSQNESERLSRFALAASALHERYPDDPDATAFHALGLLATAPAEDRTYAHQRQAAAMLTALHARLPRHPGAIHYGIHAHDFPPLAAEGAYLADVYDTVAPDVPHALHMPSHIFVRLGHWRKTVDWNHRSAEAAARQPADEARSMHYVHAMDYMMYAYLQRMHDDRAVAVVEDIDSKTDYEITPPSVYAIAAIHARLPLEQKDWQAAKDLDVASIRAEVPWSELPFAQALLIYGRGLGATRIGDPATARRALDELDSIAKKLKVASQEASNLRYWYGRAQIQRDTIDAWIAHTGGQHEQAQALMRRAAERETALGKHPTMPAFLLPARELLGDMLLEQKRPKLALEAYRASLREFPRRANSLHGAATAARQIGDDQGALDYAVRLVVMAHSQRAQRPIFRDAVSILKESRRQQSPN